MNFKTMTTYQVFPRNHTPEGTFQALQKDLPRIKGIGVDVLYLVPIHPISASHRKGTLGSPYAIEDYRLVNPEFGTLADFRSLVKKTHELGMKLMIDVVYHHTGHDSRLFREHPEYFYLKNGKPGNKVGDWWDIIDLDFTNKDLWKELIDTLVYWVKEGVDAFRCDVAPLIPIEFWKEAQKAMRAVNPEVFLFSESVHPGFIVYLRGEGWSVHSDGEMYKAFDILYDYDVWEDFLNYTKGKSSLDFYLEKVRMQQYIFPAHAVKAHFLENHDQARIYHYIPDETKVAQWTAFTFFNRGMGFIYAGQEYAAKKQIGLFDKELVDWDYKNTKTFEFFKKLVSLKKDSHLFDGKRFIIEPTLKDVIVAYHEYQDYRVYGAFNVGSVKGSLKVSIPNGTYENLINGSEIKVVRGRLQLQEQPLIFKVKTPK